MEKVHKLEINIKGVSVHAVKKGTKPRKRPCLTIEDQTQDVEVVMQIELKKVHRLEINTKGNFDQAAKAGKRSRLTIEDQTQDVEESYQCEQCHATFDIEDDFLEHIFTPHET